MPEQGKSRLRQIAVKHAAPANFTSTPADKTDSQAGHPPFPGMPVTHYKASDVPLSRQSPLPHEPPKPFKLK